MSQAKKKPKGEKAGTATELQIVGGKFRGSKLLYHGDPVTRPMKHRVREAIFNLVSTEAQGRLALDLFAGTGALGLEAISRGAKAALFIERHIPTSRVTRENIARLGVEDCTTLLEASAFVWAQRDLSSAMITRSQAEAGPLPDDPFSLPWLVFVSPPYAFFVDREAEMINLIERLVEQSPTGSTIVVESDDRFDFAKLPGPLKQSRHDTGWDVRTYSPAVVGVWRKESQQC